MIVAGIDAATATGWGAVDLAAGRLRPVRWGRIKGTAWLEVDALARVLKLMGVEAAYIEAPYVDKDPRVAILLGRIAGRFEQALERRGIACELVLGNQWQQGLLRGLITTRSKRDERKAACAQWVRASFPGIRFRTQDAADALALASWGARRRAMGAKVAAAVAAG